MKPLPPTLSSFFDKIGTETENVGKKPDPIIYRDENGLIHRENGPAILNWDGTTEWWTHGKRQRENGPAVEHANGDKEWYMDYKLHRVNGPAVIKSCGDEMWYYEGELHRTDGPAVIFVNGAKSWYIRGKLHREDGPAKEKKSAINGQIIQEWYWKGVRRSPTEVAWLVRDKHLKLNPPLLGRELSKEVLNADKKLHNPSGPARVWYDKGEEWFIDGKRHRLDGPAVVLPPNFSRNGHAEYTKFYYLFDELVSEEVHAKRVKAMEKNNSENTSISEDKRSDNEVSTAMVLVPSNDNSNVVESSCDEKKNEDNKNKIKQWPDGPDELVLYNDIYAPFKVILEKGYRLIRNANEWKFDYDGYEIGKIEKRILPNAKEHFTEKFLRREKDKNNQSLMDVVMRLIFLMGVEQGRRMAYREQEPIRSMEKTLADYRERNKSIRYQLDKAKAALRIREENPTLATDEVNKLIQIELEKTRLARIEEIRKEIKLDPGRSCFKQKTKKKGKLTDLLALANTLDSDIFTQEDWKSILNESGCSFVEWKIFCKKHKFNKFVG